MRFDLTDLRLFANIVEAGSITGGAARTHMTLASASQRVLAMEDALGAPLLDRSPQGVRPTDAGHTLVHHARLVLEQMERLRGELGEYGAGLSGHVRLLCNTTAMAEHLPGPLARFLAAYPRVTLDVEERSSEDIVAALRAGRCDLGVVTDVADVAGLESFPFRPDPLVLAVPAGHALARRKRIALAEAAGDAFVGLAAGNPLQDHVAAKAGRRLALRVRVGSFEAVCRMVEQGVGVGVVPAAVAQRQTGRGAPRFIAIAEPWAERQLLLCARSLSALPLNARRLAQSLLADPAAPDLRKSP
ncbi:LysR family transcriptional regulator [Ramlibacter sp. G-1-2-2]|uniref:LysR family transcriptional regulator n=1 Tax=Ramlibacter agri TaxID=2728837 RepID=A0A848HES4_9BURK|nr:LysR family transcriptional regulator [Ramlibacter agri]NML48692.1 LysR family transcriptional regulator [Ramlibacter agri]